MKFVTPGSGVQALGRGQYGHIDFIIFSSVPSQSLYKSHPFIILWWLKSATSIPKSASRLLNINILGNKFSFYSLNACRSLYQLLTIFCSWLLPPPPKKKKIMTWYLQTSISRENSQRNLRLEFGLQNETLKCKHETRSPTGPPMGCRTQVTAKASGPLVLIPTEHADECII